MPEYASTFLYLLVILSVLVIVHEWGHFLVARLFKMRVEEFSLFFGPKVLRLGRRGDTEYNIRAVPLGGFVRVAGMEPDDISGGRPILEAIRNPRFVEQGGADDIVNQLDADTMADMDATQVSPAVREMVHGALGPAGRLSPEGRADLEAKSHSPQITRDEHKLIQMVLAADTRASDTGLYSQKPLWQRALVIVAGPLMSLLFGYVVFCVMGITSGLPSDDATNVVQVVPGGPAYKAGLQTGDRIVAIDGKPTPDGKALTEKIHASIGVRLHLAVERKGTAVSIVATPEGRDMLIEKNGKTSKVRQGMIGIMPIPTLERHGIVSSVVQGTQRTEAQLLALVTTLGRPKQLRDDVGGPIAIYQMTNVMQRLGIAPLVMMSAAISLTLGVMNLLPIPVLDGGHLLLLAIEKVRRRRLSPREIYRAQMVGLSLLALMMVFVFYNDIVRTLSGKAFH